MVNWFLGAPGCAYRHAQEEWVDKKTRAFGFAVLLPREQDPLVMQLCCRGSSLNVRAGPGCPLQPLIAAARPLSHKQCKGRGAQECGELRARARMEHSSLYDVFTS